MPVNENSFDILLKSRQLLEGSGMCVRSYNMETTGHPGEVTTRVQEFLEVEKDGFKMSRTETTSQFKKFSGGEMKTIDIVNREGNWNIDCLEPLTIFLLKYKTRQSIAASQIENYDVDLLQKENSCKSELIKYNGQDCHAITMTLNRSLYANILRARKTYFETVLNPTLPKGYPPLDPEAFTPFLIIYYIEKETYKELGSKTFSASGNIINSFSYSSVEYGLPIDKDLFSPPWTPSYITINEASEMAPVLSEKYQKIIHQK